MFILYYLFMRQLFKRKMMKVPKIAVIYSLSSYPLQCLRVVSIVGKARE